MTWRRNGGEGLARLQAYWETMQKTVATNENVSFIVPIGTAVENARGTYINQFDDRPESQSNIAKVNLLTGQSIGSTMTPDNNNGIQRDETHMSAVVGRFLAGYTMGEMLVKHINGLGGAQFTNKTAIEQVLLLVIRISVFCPQNMCRPSKPAQMRQWRVRRHCNAAYRP